MRDAGSTDNVDFSRKTFLVIDDFQGMRTVLRDVLRSCGADVKCISTAANGREAIDMLSAIKYDVVLCDFNLGTGKNGQQVLEEAKVRQLAGPGCAWIMITAEKTSDVVTGAAEYQPDAYLLKPITEATLRQRLAKIWARKGIFAEIDRAMRNHDYLKAIKLCDERLAFDKANVSELLRTKADLLLRVGNYPQARQVFEGILADRDFPWAKTGLAKVHIQNGELEVARTLLQETVRENPYFLEAHDLLASTLQTMGHFDAAIQSLEHATKLSPNSVARQKSLGDVSLKLGHLDTAERAFRKSVNLGENSILKTADAYIGLAKTCSAKASPDEALKVLGLLNKTFDDDQSRLKSMAVEGIVHHQTGNLDKAQAIAAEMEKAISGSAGLASGQASLDVARLLFATGNQSRAVAFLQDQVRNNPENVGLLNEVKEIFVGAEMGDEGVVLVETSRREGMEMMNRGVLLARDGHYEDAVASLREAQKAMPSNVRVLLNLAYVLITRMQKSAAAPEMLAEAKSCLQEANRLLPGQTRFAQLSSSLAQIEAKA